VTPFHEQENPVAPDALVARWVQEAEEALPPELREELRAWIARARSGTLRELNEQLLREAQGAWQRFNDAAGMANNKLQE
jgi:hypothetical protein